MKPTMMTHSSHILVTSWNDAGDKTRCGNNVSAAHSCSAGYGLPTTHVKRGTIRLPAMCLNQEMFARRIRVDYEENGQRHPCPMKWMDSFSMRNFTNASVFDDTLPVADGLMEIGAKVPLGELKTAMEDWFRKKSYLPKETTLVLAET
jgi:hypothetical protein